MRKTAILTIFFVMVISNVFAQLKTVPSGSDQAVSELKFNGIANNLIADTTGSFTFNIVKTSNGNYEINGKFDNLRLFGTFKAPLETALYNPDSKTYTLTFNGNFFVGGSDGSGFPAGTTNYIKFCIVLRESVGSAVYIIGPLTENQNFEQYAIVTYTIIQSVLTPKIDDFFAGMFN